jgi:hypothetical protein
LTVKRLGRIEDILRGYKRNQMVTAVAYYAPPNVAKVVHRAVVATGSTGLVSVDPLPAAVQEKRAA